MKDEAGLKKDAVLGWGSGDVNQSPILAPDRLRIIFTSPVTGQTGAGVGASGSANGLEFMRFVPNVLNNTVADPRVGLGDFNSLGVDPGNTFEINTTLVNATSQNNFVPASYAGSTGASGLRFRDLTRFSTVVPAANTNIDRTKVLSVDNNGDVVLINPTVLTSANNGLSFSQNNVQLGAICGSPTVALAALTSNREVPLNNFNLIFSEASGGTGKVGIGVMQTLCAPGNLLEVRKGATSNISGLRLTDLVGAVPLASNGNVLSVNTNGDIILVTDQTGAGGTGITQAQNGLSINATNSNIVELGGTLLHNTVVNNAAFRLTFDINNGGNYIVGNTGNNPLSTGNSIFGSNNSFLTTNGGFGGNFVSGSNNIVDNINIRIIGSTNKVNGNNCTAIGNANEINFNNPGSGNYVMGSANKLEGSNNQAHGFDNKVLIDPLYNTTPNQSYAFGNRNFAYNNSMAIGNQVVAPPNIGMVSLGSNSGNASGAINSYFAANAGGGFNVIANAHQDPSLSGTDFIPAINIDAFNRVAIKKYIPGSALDVNGTVSHMGLNFTSDSTLKTNIQTLTINAVQKLKQFRAITYDWITKLDTAMYGTQYGFTAQQIQAVMPDLVKTGKDGIMTLNQTAIIPLLVKAIQQQQNTIDSLHKKDSIQSAQITEILNAINTLSTQVSSCCSNSSIRTTGITGNQTDVELSDKDVITLLQNVPNPYAEQTTITYNVPEQYGFAQIIFKTVDGKIIKAVDITKKGKGQLNVFASDLSQGLYMYTLIVDGKVVDTKKMVKQ